MLVLPFTPNSINLDNTSAELLSSFPSNSIDLICIDPPYLIDYQNYKWDSQDINWEILFSNFRRILKPTGNLIIFQGWSNVAETKIVGQKYFTLNNWIIWARIKHRGAKRDFGSDREDILWFVKSDKYTFNKIYSNTPKKTSGLGTKNGQKNRGLTNVWYDISPIVPWSKERVNHPTQKPLMLMERIITIFSNPNDLVLDCFAGSGSTLVAAKSLSRQYIGVEREKNYFDICVERLKD